MRISDFVFVIPVICIPSTQQLFDAAFGQSILVTMSRPRGMSSRRKTPFFYWPGSPVRGCPIGNQKRRSRSADPRQSCTADASTTAVDIGKVDKCGLGKSASTITPICMVRLTIGSGEKAAGSHTRPLNAPQPLQTSLTMGRVDDWRGGGRRLSAVAAPFRLAVSQSRYHDSVSSRCSSNRTCGTASGSRTRSQAIALGKSAGTAESSTSPNVS